MATSLGKHAYYQLRVLIYGGFFAHSVKLVLTGSVQVTQMKQSGSPLLNAVKIEYLAALADAAMQRIIIRGGAIPPESKALILSKSGGHPFIAQYLLHHNKERKFNKLITNG